MDTDDIRSYLEKRLMSFYPSKYLTKYVKSTEDIYENRAVLREILFDDRCIKYMIGLLLDGVKANKRFRRYDCLNVLKRVLKNRKSVGRLDSSITKDLFHLYKEFIFSKNNDIQWCVSTFVKDEVLEDEDINWLISHYKGSEHIVNRLLRYPTHNDSVKNWAEKVYLNGELSHRTSELIAILVDEEIPAFVDTSNSDVIMWAIFYAKCSDDTKQTLIRKYINLDGFDTAVEVAMRLRYPSVIEHILNEYDERESQY